MPYIFHKVILKQIYSKRLKQNLTISKQIHFALTYQFYCGHFHSVSLYIFIFICVCIAYTRFKINSFFLQCYYGLFITFRFACFVNEVRMHISCVFVIVKAFNSPIFFHYVTKWMMESEIAKNKELNGLKMC